MLAADARYFRTSRLDAISCPWQHYLGTNDRQRWRLRGTQTMLPQPALPHTRAAVYSVANARSSVTGSSHAPTAPAQNAHVYIRRAEAGHQREPAESRMLSLRKSLPDWRPSSSVWQRRMGQGLRKIPPGLNQKMAQTRPSPRRSMELPRKVVHSMRPLGLPPRRRTTRVQLLHQSRRQ